MEAVGRLEHVQILVKLVVLADELVAEHAETLLAQLLHLLVYCRRSLLLVRIEERVHVVGLDVASAVTARTQRPLFEHLLSQGLLVNLHRVVLVLLELTERVFLLAWPWLDLLRECSATISWWYVHAKYGPQVIHFALLSLACLDSHGADE